MSIDRKQVIAQMSQVKATANQDGLIPAFNVYVNQLPTAFWNAFAERLTRSVDDEMLDFSGASPDIKDRWGSCQIPVPVRLFKNPQQQLYRLRSLKY